MSKLVGSSEITGALYVNGIGGYNGNNPAYGVNDLATVLNNPVVVYETDGTTGLLGLNASPMDETTWQLENLDLTPYRFIWCYFKQSIYNSSSDIAQLTCDSYIVINFSMYCTFFTTNIIRIKYCISINLEVTGCFRIFSFCSFFNCFSISP